MTRKQPAGRQVQLTAQAGEAHLSLGESPTTGYLWHLTDLPPEVEVLGTDFQVAPTQRLGTPGERKFHLRAQTPGMFSFTARLARGNGPADEEVRVTLEVSDTSTD